jgi:hypothetical protein
MEGFLRPKGDIVTLLDLSPRDSQDSEYTPLSAEKTWWLPDQSRRIRPFSITLQQFPFRGPTAFGQRFTFDIGSVNCGDLLTGALLQIDLGHWLDDATLLRLQAGTYGYAPGQAIWAYANSLGTAIVQSAEFEVNEQTLEKLDGDFIFTSTTLFGDLNKQYGIATDGLGLKPLSYTPPTTSPFPTQSGTLLVPLNFFFQRVPLAEAFPLLSCADGSVRIHITLRPFSECVRLLSGTSPSPLNTTFSLLSFLDRVQEPVTVQTQVAAPSFKGIKLITYGAHMDGKIRTALLRQPFELMTRTVQTFFFDEPLKYTINKTADLVQIQLPIEANGPMEELIWFVRRKDATAAREWTNFSAVTGAEFDPVYNPLTPLLQKAKLQCNGIDLVSQDERWFRQHSSMIHKGGIASYTHFIYGYSFAASPGEHQPSGTVNASRLQTIRLTLDVIAAGAWEVKVFVLGIDWIRFQNGIANRMFST